MTTDRRTTALAATIDHLGWFKIPHTIDQVVGIYAEATREQAGTTARTRSNQELVDGMKAASANGRGSKGGHSDPTPEAALRSEPDAVDDDDTMGAIDHALVLITEASIAADHTVSDALGLDRWLPPRRYERQAKIAETVSRIHHLQPNLTAALEVLHGSDLHDLDRYLITELPETSEWLHIKAETIWLASRGETRVVAQQQTITVCKRCSPWRSGTIATRAGLCAECAKFKSNHGCLPTEAIVRRWDYGRGATPAQIAEAKATSRRKVRAS